VNYIPVNEASLIPIVIRHHPSSALRYHVFVFFRAEAAMIFLVSKLASLDFQAADISRFDYTSYICRLFA